MKDSGDFLRLFVIFDTLDDANFPRHGYYAAAATATTIYSSDKDHPVQTLQAQFQLPLTFDRLTFLGLGFLGRSKDDRGGFGLGGFLSLSGTPVNAVSGSQSGILAGLAYYRMGELPRAMGKSWYAGMSLEAGNAWARSSDIKLSDTRKAISFFLGLDTILGPLYVGYGHTFGGDSAAYLFLGRITNGS